MRLPDGPVARLPLDAAGRIAALDDADAPTLDAEGRLAIPALAEPHVHVDRAFGLEVTGANASGTLGEAIERFVASIPRMSVRSLTPGAVRALLMLRSAGVGHVQAHTAVGGDLGFRAWEAVEEAARLVPGIEVRQIPTPMDPATHRPEAASVLREAAARGAVSIGGAPWLSDRPDEATRASVALAAELGLRLDLHVDESDDPAVDTLDVLASAVAEAGLGGRAVAHHCCSLAGRPLEVIGRQAEALAAGGVGVVVCPVSNLALQGRTSGVRGLAPVRALRDAGVSVAVGTDNIRDVVVSVGTADPLRAGWLLALAAHLLSEDDLAWLGRVVVEGNREACGLDPGLDPGRSADLLLVEAPSMADTVALVPDRRWVGELISAGGSSLAPRVGLP